MSVEEKTSDYFLHPNEFSDVKITLKHEPETILYANKAILSEASPIIKAFLAIEPDGTFLIDEDEDMFVLRSSDVRDLLKFIYPQFTMKVHEENINGLIHLSEKYLIETLRNECKKFVWNALNDLQIVDFEEKKYLLYKDGRRKALNEDIGRWCTWFHEYSSRDEHLASSILQFLKQAPTDELEKNFQFNQLIDREKSQIYKSISEFIEERTIQGTTLNSPQQKPSVSFTFASGDR